MQVVTKRFPLVLLREVDAIIRLREHWLKLNREQSHLLSSSSKVTSVKLEKKKNKTQMAILYRFFPCSMSNEFFCGRNGTMTNCGGTRVNTAEWERFMSPPKLFGYQTLSFITSKKYHIMHGSSVSVSEMSIRCLYSITIWPLAITFFPRRNARDDDNWGRLINSYRNWDDGSAITTYQLHSQTLHF